MRLNQGYLYVRLPYARGEIGFDWSQIAHIESAESFVVADKTQKRYSGTLQTVADGSIRTTGRNEGAGDGTLHNSGGLRQGRG